MTRSATTTDARIDTLSALGLPLSDELAGRVARIGDAAVWRHSHRLLDDATVARLWTQWHPAKAQRATDARFVDAMRILLADGLALGYRLDRFRDTALSETDMSEPMRIAAFEGCIAGNDCARLRLWVSRAQFEALRSAAPPSVGHDPDPPWAEQLALMSDGLFYELGLTTSAPEIGVDEALQLADFRCEWNDLKLPAQSGLPAGSVLVSAKVHELALLRITGRQAFNPATGAECALIDGADRSAALEAGLQTWSARGHLILSLAAVIREQAAALVNRSMFELYRQRLREFYPALLTTVEQRFEADFVTQVLRGLLADGLSVRNLSAILQSLLELRAVIAADPKCIVFLPSNGGVFVDHRPRELSALGVADYVEQVRIAMRRYISHKYTRGQSTMVVYLVDPPTEERLLRQDQVDEATASAICRAAETELGESKRPGDSVPIVLTTNAVRRKLQQVLRTHHPRLVVLSYQELSPEMNIQPIGRITPDFDDDA